MRFYEIHDPYYALIKARDEVDATRKYIDVVAGCEEEFEEIREKMSLVEKDYVIGALAHSIDDSTGEKITIKELKQAINEEITEVLLIDGLLIWCTFRRYSDITNLMGVPPDNPNSLKFEYSNKDITLGATSLLLTRNIYWGRAGVSNGLKVITTDGEPRLRVPPTDRTGQGRRRPIHWGGGCMLLERVRRLLGRVRKSEQQEYEELVVTMGELQEGDLVYGTDGKWHKIRLLPVHIPDRMYRLEFDNGSVECSGDHLWTVYDSSGSPETLRTDQIAQKDYIGTRFGTVEGPRLLSIQEIEPTESRCIEVDNNDHLFEILTDEGDPVFTHNCQFRMVCGRLGRVASMMALDSTLATTIDAERKGAGIISSNGIVEHIQYYYADQNWIEDWYAKRGLTPTGHQPNEEEEAEIFDDFEGTEEIAPNREVIDIEFAGVHGQVDKTPDQKFEEIWVPVPPSLMKTI